MLKQALVIIPLQSNFKTKKGNVVKFLVKTLSATALLSFALGAHALSDQASPDQSAIPQMPHTKAGFHVVLNGGMTYGGDTIATARYTDGSTQDIKAGSLIQIGAGALYQFDERPLALMLSANYQFDTATGSNGDLTFGRYPIEALAYYTGKERFRIGGGLRFVNSPEFNATINGITDKIIFDRTTGLVAEVGYQLSPRAWINFRFVSEKYKPNRITWSGGAVTSLVGFTSSVSGSHLGANLTYEF